jgi:phage anti-repressor protein
MKTLMYNGIECVCLTELHNTLHFTKNKIVWFKQYQNSLNLIKDVDFFLININKTSTVRQRRYNIIEIYITMKAANLISNKRVKIISTREGKLIKTRVSVKGKVRKNKSKYISIHTGKSVKACVYKITNLINGKIYIGKTINHHTGYMGSGTLIIKAIKKYGIHNFKKEMLITYTNDDTMLKKYETYFIRKYNTLYPNGYNIKLKQ